MFASISYIFVGRMVEFLDFGLDARQWRSEKPTWRSVVREASARHVTITPGGWRRIAMFVLTLS